VRNIIKCFTLLDTARQHKRLAAPVFRNDACCGCLFYGCQVTDWVAWHVEYETPKSPLSQRLAVVRETVQAAVATHEASSMRVLSICSGDARDLVPVLARARRRKNIRGRLIEMEPELAQRARGELERAGIHGVEVICGDAGRPGNYSGAIPADLVVLCGVFGNVSDHDVYRLIKSLPALCAIQSEVIWTRYRRDPDLTPLIREWFSATGFEERAFRSPGPGHFAVGRHQLVRPASETKLPDPLFTFIR
jgi:hypothetical protein